MNPSNCPRFDACSAPLCPLDARWQFRFYQRGEAVCGFVLEAVKPNGDEIVRRQLSDAAMSEAVLQAAPEMANKFPFIAERLARSSAQKSRIRSAEAARKGRPASARNVA